MKISDLPEENLFTSGHTACAGCGAAIAVRNILKILGPKTIVYNPACCLLVFSTTYPLCAWKVPFHQVAFETTGASISGIRRALKKLGREDVTVVGIAGDGGTVDIGLQALSGAAERNEDVLYICYDNEAYMNTGIQRSGATPYGALTTTTPAGRIQTGNLTFKKDMPMIVAAHHVPYVATTSISYPVDFINKLVKARDIRGFRYIQILCPCPTGWRYEPERTIEIGRLAVESGMWSLYEIEHGRLKITKKPKLLPVKDYLSAQGRFRNMRDEDIEKLQTWVNEKWKREEEHEKLCRGIT